MFQNLTRREFIKTTLMAAAAMTVPVEGFAADKTKADLVVYGKIFTAEGNQIVDAFAVKDGKFVYVGNRAGAAAFIDKGKTEVIDYTGKGLVMPSCGNGHAHYSAGHTIQAVGTVLDKSDTLEKLFAESIPAAVKKARAASAKAIFGSGWDRNFPPNFPYRQRLDAICSDIPIYFADEEGHKGMANTLALVNAGIMSKDGTVLKKEMRGGVIAIGADGTPTGYLSEQAGTFVRSFLDNEYLFSVDVVKGFIPKIEQQLHSEGYTMYLDGFSTYFFNTNFHKSAQEMDKAGDMHFVLGLTYEIEGWMNPDEALPKAVDAKKYSSTRVKPNWIKLFIDGTVESGTGFIDPVYNDGHQVPINWSEEAMTDITRKANAQGLTMHIHAMGNAGVNRVVNSFINGGKDEMRNTLVHVYGVIPSDYKRMAEHNIYVTEGMLWHHNSDELRNFLLERLPEDMGEKGFPMKSRRFVRNYGNPLVDLRTHHTRTGYKLSDNQRRAGKYADFLLVNKDVLTCPTMEIHTAKPAATYFEGKKVFSM